MADFASLMQESKERCNTVICMHVCYVFQGDSLLAILPQLSQERARRDVYTVSCMLCVMFSGRSRCWLILASADAGEQADESP